MRPNYKSKPLDSGLASVCSYESLSFGVRMVRVATREPWDPILFYLLLSEAEQILCHLVNCVNQSRTCTERALGNDQSCKFIGQIHVGSFQ